ncbi:MAG: AraC family transcriptional regulator [Clostridia bacterium]|nr:AraC family transcriptional regulator [Clostridia bacterium]
MIKHEFIIQNDNRETTERGTPSMPLSMYLTRFSHKTAYAVPWHWHGDVEIVLVKRGSMRLELKRRSLILSAGEGAFINTGTLHAMRRQSQESCEMISAVFDPAMIAGSGTAAEMKYVLPILKCGALDMLLLEPDTQWQLDVLVALRDAYSVYARPYYGYELKLRELLCRIWRRLAVHLKNLVEETGERAYDMRIRLMMGYIAENYMQRITLEDIANAASISVRECSRCFHTDLGMTPFAYLINHRVRIATELLTETEMAITDICFAVGFNSTSYFAKVFREHTGQTPRAYREGAAQNDPLAEN